MKTLPIFPLPGVVLFPGTLLPLHIFEPRYRRLVEDALSGDGLIGMTMIAEDEDEAANQLDEPHVRVCGGAGKIVEHERLEDGRYNIVLEGTFRFRIVEEVASSPYRRVTAEESPVEPFENAREENVVVGAARELFGSLCDVMEIPPLPKEEISPERLSGELALRLRWPPEALQILLEAGSLKERFAAIVARLAEWRQTADLLLPYRPDAIRPGLN